MAENQTQIDQWKALERGCLWQRETKTGGTYFTGTVKINGVEEKLVVFSNRNKKNGDNQPDYRIYKSVPREGVAAPAAKPAAKAVAQPARKPVVKAPVETVEETPEEGLL